MIFNSIQYLIFLPLVMAIYLATPRKFQWVPLLIASYYFYMCWRAEYAVLIVLSTAINYYCAIVIDTSRSDRIRKLVFAASIATNLIILFTFKYWNFFTDNFNAALQIVNIPKQFPSLSLLLPLGISFYTFQSLSYTIDVYRRDCPAEKHFGYFALYHVYFPQLVAGPIERVSHLLPQLKSPTPLTYERLATGIERIIWGLFKKIFVADRLAYYVNTVYAAPDEYHGTALLIATYFFAFQIYADFSGYSDIAIGSARLIGVDLMENFRQPYFSQNVGEFWRRWHISLSQFFRDYVYFPLGGSRNGTLKRSRNMLVVFILSGLWHGAAWTYVIWGVLHGLLVIVNSGGRSETPSPLGRRILCSLATFHLVLVTWVFFRAKSVADAFTVFRLIASDGVDTLRNLADFQPRFFYWETVLRVGIDKEEFLLCLTSILALLLADGLLNSAYWQATLQLPRWRLARMVAFDGLIILTVIFGAFGKSEFIYFQF